MIPNSPTCPECKGRGMIFLARDPHAKISNPHFVGVSHLGHERFGHWDTCPRCNGCGRLLTADGKRYARALLEAI